MATEQAPTNLERQIRSQPDALEEMLSSPTIRSQVHEAVQGLHRARRIWLVGTGTSQHAAAIGAGMIQEAGRSAHAVSSMQFVHWAPIVAPKDAVVIITHTAETPYALSAHALAFDAGMDTVMITRRGAGFPGAIETVDKETSETYTVSYTTAVMALAMIAHEMGADRITAEALAQVPGAVAAAIDRPEIGSIATPERLLVFTGAGPASTTAREGALKVRESSRLLAEGYDAEYLLHGSAVPLTGDDRLVSLFPPDNDGFVDGLTAGAEKAGVPVSRLSEPADLPAVLAQIPLTVRLQLLGLRIATERGQDPDHVITGGWADEALWSIGAPSRDRQRLT
jgi:glucosamine--fructose-6-phosphate aminotransferase (isomerizing)